MGNADGAGTGAGAVAEVRRERAGAAPGRGGGRDAGGSPGTYPDGSAAVALRRTPLGPSLFVGPPGLTSELLRLAARVAGVPLFTQTDCHIYANGPFLVFHAAQVGPVVIDTGKAGPTRDVLSGQVVGQGPKLPLTLRRGETRVLRY